MSNTPVAIPRSDAFVFFGASGDLARKQVWPALHGLVRRRELDVPIVAVSRSIRDLETLQERVRQSLTEHGGADPAAVRRLAGRLRADPRNAGRRRAPGSLPCRPPSLSRITWID